MVLLASDVPLLKVHWNTRQPWRCHGAVFFLLYDQWWVVLCEDPDASEEIPVDLVDDFDTTENLELGVKAQEEEEQNTAVYRLQYSILLRYKNEQ